MINIERYNNLKKEFGHVASWAVWANPTSGIKSDVDIMTIFENDNVCNILNNSYVFVGLNGSDTHNNQSTFPWKNFHSSDKKRQHDYKLRYALRGTKFWGSYITDIIKEFNGNLEQAKDKDSRNIMSKLRKHPEEVDKNIEIFKSELDMLTYEKPILIAMGREAYNILNKNLDGYNIYYIKHYSNWISSENYKNEVWPILKTIP